MNRTKYFWLVFYFYVCAVGYCAFKFFILSLVIEENYKTLTTDISELSTRIDALEMDFDQCNQK